MPENPLFVLFSQKMQYLLCMTKLSNLIWKRLETRYLCYTWLHHDHARCQTLHLEVFENSTALVKTLWCVRLILIFTLQWVGEAGYQWMITFRSCEIFPQRRKNRCALPPHHRPRLHQNSVMKPDFLKHISSPRLTNPIRLHLLVGKILYILPYLI